MLASAESPLLAGSIRFAVLPEQAGALLRQLGTASVDWSELAEEITHSPGLLHALLTAAPLEARRLERDLKDRVIERLRSVGVELLRAWLLQESWNPPPSPRVVRELHARSVMAAECALHLALETRYPYPDEAYLAGLWHCLDELLIPPEVDAPFGSPSAKADATALRAALLATCGVNGPIGDALRFGAELEERFAFAHPLTKLLRAAVQLAADDWNRHVDSVSGLCALSTSALFSLRTDVAFIAQQRIAPDRIAPPALTDSGSEQDRMPARALSLPMLPGLPDDFLRRAALAGCIRNAFASLEPECISSRFMMSIWLLCRTRVPLIVTVSEQDDLVALALGDDAGIHAYFNELKLHLEDETSVIALALRTGEPSSRTGNGDTPGRAVADWHVSQWLRTDTLICLPLSCKGRRVVAVLASDREAPPRTEICDLLVELGTEAADAWLRIDTERARQDRMSAEIEGRFREHARRIVHEASNPLTVIKSYLEVMPDRHPEARALNDELRILKAEVERLGSLFREVAHPPAQATEPATCRIPDVLEEMRTLYGEALFIRRGIQFEVRTSAALPPAAMPASALKQVLLNLFRNAAEALQPGKRLSIVVPGQLIINGIACIEIRVIDNGPGLPAERLSRLFAAHPSAKGGEHQGLGLSIVNEILGKWHGSILCRSQPGTGTSFQLLVPAKESS